MVGHLRDAAKTSSVIMGVIIRPLFNAAAIQALSSAAGLVIALVLACLSSFWLFPNCVIEQCGDRRCEAFSKSFHEYMRMVESILFKKAED